jgi:DNA-binding response OmpR family regulator
MTTGNGTKIRVLVVEDETLIAIMIEDTLIELGCEIVGPTGKLDMALQLTKEGNFDAAILDVTIRGGKVYPVAEQLAERGIPFVFASGHGDWALPETLRNKPRLTKPFTVSALEERIRFLCEEAAHATQAPRHRGDGSVLPSRARDGSGYASDRDRGRPTGADARRSPSDRR